MTSKKIVLGLALTLGTFAGVDAHAGDKPLKAAYLRYEINEQSGRPLKIEAALGGYSGSGKYAYATGFKRSRAFTISDVTPRGVAATMRYNGERFGNETLERQGIGHGFITAVAAKDRGIVIVDTTTAAIAHNTKPVPQPLLSLEKIRRSRALTSAAKAAGLDTKSLTVKVSDTLVSNGYTDGSLITLAFTAHVRDAAGKATKLDLSTLVDGQFSPEGKPTLKAGRLEAGVRYSWGWAYPPSQMASK